MIENKYKKIFKLIDKIIFLSSELDMFISGDCYERKLKAVSNGKKTMNDIQIKNFIMYYERLTKHMIQNFEPKADTIIKIDDKHKLKSIKYN